MTSNLNWSQTELRTTVEYEYLVGDSAPSPCTCGSVPEKATPAPEDGFNWELREDGSMYTITRYWQEGWNDQHEPRMNEWWQFRRDGSLRTYEDDIAVYRIRRDGTLAKVAFHDGELWHYRRDDVMAITEPNGSISYTANVPPPLWEG